VGALRSSRARTTYSVVQVSPPKLLPELTDFYINGQSTTSSRPSTPFPHLSAYDSKLRQVPKKTVEVHIVSASTRCLRSRRIAICCSFALYFVSSNSRTYHGYEEHKFRAEKNELVAVRKVTPGTAHQHSSHFIPASLQINPTNTAYGFPPGQNLQYACQLGVPPNPQEGERNPQSKNLSAAEYTNLGSSSGSAAGTGNYIPWFPESDDAFDPQAHAPAQAPGLSPDAGFGASTNNYVPWFPESRSSECEP